MRTRSLVAFAVIISVLFAAGALVTNNPTTARAAGNPDVVSAEDWDDGEWPLTIDGGILTCVRVPVVGRPEAVLIYDHDGKAWPVNGMTRSMPRELYTILAKHGGYPPARFGFSSTFAALPGLR